MAYAVRIKACAAKKHKYYSTPIIGPKVHHHTRHCGTFEA